MTSLRFYNPCDDGFVAKVWECLRRNEHFRARVPDGPFPKLSMAVEQVAGVFLQPHSPAREAMLLASSKRHLEHTWPELSETERQQIGSPLKRETIRKLKLPQKLNPHRMDEFSEDPLSRRFLGSLLSVRDSHVVLAIPNRFACTHALHRRVAGFGLGAFAVDLHELRVIDVGSERICNRDQIGFVTISRELHAVRETRSKVMHEVVSRARVTRADVPAGDQLRVRVDGGPGSAIAPSLGLRLFRRVFSFALTKEHTSPHALAGQPRNTRC
jgi:hypothetical protein